MSQKKSPLPNLLIVSHLITFSLESLSLAVLTLPSTDMTPSKQWWPLSACHCLRLLILSDRVLVSHTGVIHVHISPAWISHAEGYEEPSTLGKRAVSFCLLIA